MKSKVYFLADMCIRISTYRKPSINGKELEMMEAYCEDLKVSLIPIQYKEYLAEETKRALYYLAKDKDNNLNLNLLDAELILEKLLKKIR